MSKKKTHEEFIEELKAKNEYMYNTIEFLEKCDGFHKKIKVRDKYGEIMATPKSLIKNSRTKIQSAINKSDYFINQAMEIHGNRYDYSNTVYEKIKQKVTIICKEHGEFLQTPDMHLQGANCQECSGNKKRSHNDFLEKLKEERADVFNSIEFIDEYINNNTPILAKNEYGIIKVYPANLLFYKGTININNAVDKTEYFKAYCRDKNYESDKYNYSLAKYNGSKNNVTLICPIHGEFDVNAGNHMYNNAGCSQCNKLNSSRDVNDWVRLSKRFDKFESYKLYKIRCWNDNENFIKIGITYKTVKDRFSRKRDLPYSYEVLELIESQDPEYIWNLEIELHNKYYKNKYYPQLAFGGRTECFSKLSE